MMFVESTGAPCASRKAAAMKTERPSYHEPVRGFPFMRDGPLDMRMNPAAPVTAPNLVNNASGEQLERIFRNFGEEPAARRVALQIVRDRLQRPFATTFDLVRSVENVLPR